MKRYLLLRDNQEKGPFTWEELNDFGLKSNDLIWIDRESTRWHHPNEIQGFVTSNFPYNNVLSEQVNRGVTLQDFKPSIEVQSLPNTADSFPNLNIEEPDQEASYVATKNDHSLQPYRPKKSALFGAYGVWITILVMLLGSTVWMFKIAIDVFKGKGFVQTGLTQVGATIKPLPEDLSPTKAQEEIYQNALTREIVPVDTILDKEPVKKIPEFKELKKYLRIEANDYKVNVLGGINELKLTVRNNSGHTLEKVVLQLDYLKPNGESIQTDKYTYFSIVPHGSKTLEIPPSRRGVKIKYKIIDAKPREYKITLVQA